MLLAGRAGGPEEQLVPAAGLRLETVRMRGFDRDALWKNLALPYLLPAGFVRGVQIVDRFKPDVALGVGGYVMTPALAGCRLRGVPYVLQISEAGGLANRLFRAGAAAACVTFPKDVGRFVTRHTVLTGYPLRPGFARRSPNAPAQTLLIIGGSQGARRLNQAVWGALDQLCSRYRQVVHLTGAQGEAEAAAHARSGYRPLSFTTGMAELMAEADLVVCRAGVGTISELTAVGLPAVLVPGSFGGGHQARNADDMVEAGAAVKLGDAELTPATLLSTLAALQPEQLRSMADASAALGRPDAATRIVAVLREAARR